MQGTGVTSEAPQSLHRIIDPGGHSKVVFRHGRCDTCAHIEEAFSERERQALERAATIACHFCGNDFGMWEPRAVRFGSDYKHRAKDDHRNLMDCAASGIHALIAEASK